MSRKQGQGWQETTLIGMLARKQVQHAHPDSNCRIQRPPMTETWIVFCQALAWYSLSKRRSLHTRDPTYPHQHTTVTTEHRWTAWAVSCNGLQTEGNWYINREGPKNIIHVAKQEKIFPAWDHMSWTEERGQRVRRDIIAHKASHQQQTRVQNM